MTVFAGISTSLCQKLSSSIFALRLIMCIATPDATRKAYRTLVDSYQDPSKENVHRVLTRKCSTGGHRPGVHNDVLQKRAVRILGGLQLEESWRDIIKILGIQTLVTFYISDVVAFVNGLNLLRNEH
ncbi:hypothetical protein J6590_026408 [Homalodisca vitripennis]|nr:hypothetical protein J6590_026408 [Homalodisca vitripennis]